MGAAARRLAPTAALLPALLALNALLALVLIRESVTLAIVVGALPLALIAFGALVASDRSILVFAALALPVSFHTLNVALPLPGSKSIYASDILVALALGSWAASRLIARAEGRGRRPHRFTPAVLGFPFIAFLLVTLWAAERGHARYGASIFGEPVRLIVYAGIGLALCDVTPAKAYRGIVAVFYAGSLWMLLNTMYLLATGGSQTPDTTEALSTGGQRVVSLAVALHLAAALFLSLLNLEIDSSGRRRLVHLAVSGMSTLGILLAFGRGTFAAVAVAVPLLLALAPRTRRTLLGFLPLTLPIVVAVTIAIGQLAPSVGPTLVRRINVQFIAQGQDASARWREEANKAIFRQVDESPLTGVGFGRGAEFTLNGVTYRITQDPHNSFVWLLAGGGILLLSLFVLLLVRFAWDVVQRLRAALPIRERILVAWSALALLSYLVNAVVGPLLSSPSELLVVWVLLLLPGVVTRPRREQEA